MFKRIDWILLLSLMALLVMGFAVLYSAAYRMEFSDVTKNYFTKQVVWVCLGLIAVLLLSFVNYKSIGNISVVIYAPVLTFDCMLQLPHLPSQPNALLDRHVFCKLRRLCDLTSILFTHTLSSRCNTR